MNMLPIGIHGRIRTVKSISEVPERDSEKDRVAIIYKNDSILENLGIRKEEENKEYNFWDASDGTIAVDKVNVLTVLLAKGLEFERVIVSFSGMSKQEKYVACTRALNELYILKEK
jgi:DNA helicase IV